MVRHDRSNLTSVIYPIGKLVAFIFVMLLFFVFLPSVFSGERSINGTAFAIGSFEVRWYGIMIGLGAIAAYSFIFAESKRKNVIPENIDSVILLVFVLGLIGGRLGFVIQNISYFSRNPLEMIKLYHGGLSIHGALICGLIALLISAKIFKVSFYKIADTIAPPVLLAIAIGRWGNFFNQEIIGQPTNVPWKMYVATFYRPAGFEGYTYFHPVFIYESLSLTIIFFLYWRLLRDRNIGLIFTLYAYCLVRIIVEFWRIDYKPIILGLDLAQIVSFAIILATGIIYYLAKKYVRTRTI